MRLPRLYHHCNGCTWSEIKRVCTSAPICNTAKTFTLPQSKIGPPVPVPVSVPVPVPAPVPVPVPVPVQCRY